MTNNYLTVVATAQLEQKLFALSKGDLLKVVNERILWDEKSQAACYEPTTSLTVLSALQLYLQGNAEVFMQLATLQSINVSLIVL